MAQLLVCRCQRRTLRNQPALLCALPARSAHGIPALIVDTAVVGSEFLGCLHRNMHSLKADVGEKRLGAGLVFFEIGHHLADQKLG